MAVIALVVIGYFVWSGYNRRVVENSTMLAEEAQTLYQDWQNASDQEKKAQLESELQEKLGQIIRRYPHQYAAARALFIRGEVAADEKKWQDAARDFQDLARSFPDGYLAAISMFNAAVALEEQAQLDAAIAEYQALVKKFPDSYLIPHVLFSLGRLYEAQGNFKEAAAQYNRLIDEQAASSWTNLARNRIIELQIQGKIAQ